VSTRSLAVTVPILAAARAAIRHAEADDLERRDARTFRRRLVHEIDDALDECERANLDGLGRSLPPRSVAPLVEWLQEAARESIRRPRTTQEALDELLRLQAPYLRTVRYPGEDDPRLDDPETAGELATCWHGNGVCDCAAVPF
jgi:hypothetical protein